MTYVVQGKPRSEEFGGELYSFFSKTTLFLGEPFVETFTVSAHATIKLIHI